MPSKKPIQTPKPKPIDDPNYQYYTRAPVKKKFITAEDLWRHIESGALEVESLETRIEKLKGDNIQREKLVEVLSQKITEEDQKYNTGLGAGYRNHDAVNPRVYLGQNAVMYAAANNPKAVIPLINGLERAEKMVLLLARDNKGRNVLDLLEEKSSKKGANSAEAKLAIDGLKNYLKKDFAQLQIKPMSAQEEYSHNVAASQSSRWHAVGVSAADFNDVKIKYQGQKGDYLKSNILANFKGAISQIKDKGELDKFVKHFKTTDEYKVLEKGQGLATRLLGGLLNLETSSIKAFNEMVTKAEKNLGSNAPTQALKKG